MLADTRTDSKPNTPWLDLRAFQKIHLVGIGGSGLSAIAAVLLEKGFDVSGSDLQANTLTDALSKRGAKVYIGHAPEHVRGADLVVVSSAVPPDNAEWAEAVRLEIPVTKRGPLLAALLSGAQGIAVAGSHGKTTTAGMIAHILNEAGLDPSFIIGGVVANFGTNARAGKGPHFVLEADEYDRTFLAFHPKVSVITNVEMDHPDCYRDETDLREAFRQFAAQTSRDGLLLGFGDDPEVARLMCQVSEETGVAAQTFGFSKVCAWTAIGLRTTEFGGTEFTAARGGSPVAEVQVSLPGDHNALNGLAALAVAVWLGVGPQDAARALRGFQGTHRRLEVRGMGREVAVLDDYAHHPTQIAATLRAVRQKYGGREIWAVFQPHTYSRLKALWNGFAACFGDADHVVVLPVYPAREAHDPTVRPDQLAREMNHPDVRFASGLSDAAALLATAVKPGDVVITLGAGDEWKVGDGLLERLGRDLAQTLHVED